MRARPAVAVMGLLSLASAGRPMAAAAPPASAPLASVPLASVPLASVPLASVIDGCTQEHPASLPRLAGVVVTGGERRATFAGGKGLLPTTVGEGDSVGGRSVVAITPGCVQLRDPAGTYWVSPAADPDLRAAMAAAHAPALAQGQAQADNDK